MPLRQGQFVSIKPSRGHEINTDYTSFLFQFLPNTVLVLNLVFKMSLGKKKTGEFAAMPLEIINRGNYSCIFATLDELKVFHKIQLGQGVIQVGELRVRPLVLYQSFINRLKGDAGHGNADEL